MRKKEIKPGFEVTVEKPVNPKFRIVGNGNCWTIERNDGESFKPCHKNGNICDFDKFELPFVYRNEAIAKDNLKVIEKSNR
jgi:hypothetical protein